MKKFSFPLEKVLKYKDSLLDEEKNKLAQLRHTLNTIEERIEECKRQLEESDIKLKEHARKGSTVMQLGSLSFQIENTRCLIKDLEQNRQNQEKLVERQLAAVLIATQEVNGLEKLREKQLDEYNETLRKENELFISEMISSQYTRSDRSR